MEDLNDKFEIASKRFFDSVDGVKLINYNQGNEKYYSDIYQILKKETLIDGKDIEVIIATRFYKKFYKAIL
tara:strand:- start:104 stop:316 length:213 start_codon:yes stop_codon:yes gene_type:complete